MRSGRSPRFLFIPLGLSLLIYLGLTLWKSLRRPEVPIPDIEIQLSKKALWRIRLQRQEALERGVLLHIGDPWVSAQVNELPAKLRLKGDWPDHLRGQKWSFRVEMKDSFALMRFTEFSLQAPETRDFLHEWVFHQALQREGLLAPRYTFARLHLNGANLGLYAVEEHFTKGMLESQGRRDGPILRFNEDALWQARARSLAAGFGAEVPGPWFEAAHIEPFRKKKWSKSIMDNAQLIYGQVLMHQYRNKSLNADAIFDLEQMAANYAMTDLALAHHSFIWHNRCFYFNPLTQKLEPVAFDAYSGEDPRQYANGPFTGFAANGQTFYNLPGEQLGHIFTGNRQFLRYYYDRLWTLSSRDYVDSLFVELEPGLSSWEAALSTEYPSYHYNREFLSQNAAIIRQGLQDWREEMVKVDWQMGENGEKLICLQNYLPLSIELLGWGDQDSLQLGWDEPYLLFPFDAQNPADFAELSVSGSHLWLRVTAAPDGEIRQLALPAPTSKDPGDEDPDQ